SSPQFERLWRAHVKRRFGWLQVLAQTAFIWAIATMLVIALFIRRRRRDRARMAQLREAEIPDSPAYWMGEDAVGREVSPPPDDNSVPGEPGPPDAGAGTLDERRSDDDGKPSPGW